MNDTCGALCMNNGYVRWATGRVESVAWLGILGSRMAKAPDHGRVAATERHGRSNDSLA